MYSDWACWIRLMLRSRPRFMDSVLARYRVHGGNVSVGRPLQETLRYELQLFEYLVAELSSVSTPAWSAQHTAGLRLQAASRNFALGNSEHAEAHVRGAGASLSAVPRSGRWLAGWLQRRMQERWATELAPGLGREFAGLVFAQLERGPAAAVVDAARGRLVALELRQRALVRAVDGNRDAARDVVRCWRQDGRMLFDRTLLVAFAKSLLGPRVTGALRRFTKPQPSSGHRGA
jgi:hypothetical protein